MLNISSRPGINDFESTAKLSDIKVTGSGGDGGDEFIVAPLTTELQNPSNVSLHTVDIALPVIYKGTMIGRAAINVCPFSRTSLSVMLMNYLSPSIWYLGIWLYRLHSITNLEMQMTPRPRYAFIAILLQFLYR